MGVKIVKYPSLFFQRTILHRIKYTANIPEISVPLRFAI